jgi:peroxiredoxin
MKKLSWLFISSFLAILSFAYSRSFQSNTIWLILGFVIYLLVGFFWNRSKISQTKKLAILGIPILLDAIFTQVVAIRPLLVIMPISGFVALLIGLNFKKNYFYGTALVTLIISNIILAFYFFPHQIFQEQIVKDSRKIPDATFVDATSDTLSTKDFEGKVVLVDMWYGACGACFMQFNETEEIYQHFKNNPKVIIIGLNTGIDSYPTFLGACRLIRERKGYNFPLWLDYNKSFMNNLQMKGFPQNLLIDKQGTIRYIYQGFSKDTKSMYSKNIIKMIEEMLI